MSSTSLTTTDTAILEERPSIHPSPFIFRHRVLLISSSFTFFCLVAATANVTWVRVGVKDHSYSTSIWERKGFINSTIKCRYFICSMQHGVNYILVQESWPHYCRNAASSNALCTKLYSVQAAILSAIVLCMLGIKIGISAQSSHKEILRGCLNVLASLLSVVSWILWLFVEQDSTFQSLFRYQGIMIQQHQLAEGFMLSLIGSIIAILLCIVVCCSFYVDQQRLKKSQRLHLITPAVAKEFIPILTPSSGNEPQRISCSTSSEEEIIEKPITKRYSSTAMLEYEMYHYSSVFRSTGSKR